MTLHDFLTDERLVVPFEEAIEILRAGGFRMSRSGAYALAARGDLPGYRKCGRRAYMTRAGMLDLLGIEAPK